MEISSSVVYAVFLKTHSSGGRCTQDPKMGGIVKEVRIGRRNTLN